nr:Putative uncharacterized protein [Moritella viscosa]
MYLMAKKHNQPVHCRTGSLEIAIDRAMPLISCSLPYRQLRK